MSTLNIDTAPSRPASLEQLSSRNAAYLERPRSDAWSVLFAKLSTGLWRRRQCRLLLDDAIDRKAAGDAVDARALIDGLLATGVCLDDKALAALEGLVPEAGLRAEILARQGRRCPDSPALHASAGPDLDLKIEVNRDSPWPFERWREQAGFSEYEFIGEGVRYRGLDLMPGDLLLPNVNLDGNFVYSAISDPKGFCPHSAMFGIFEHDGRRFPTIVETYEKGLRAVPLCVFVNERYISYAEVYRHRDLPTDDYARINGWLADAIARAKGYNFDTTDPDQTYVCCVSVTQQFYEAFGLQVVGPPGAIRDEGIRQTMTSLDYPWLDAFLTPIDFVLSPLLDCVGVIDNGQMARLVTREFVERRFRHCFSTGRIDPDRMPLQSRLVFFGIGQMRRRTLIGRLVSLIMGFDHENLPKGPDRILAIVEPLEAELGAAVRKLMPEVTARLDALEPDAIEDFLADPELCARADALLPMKWIRPA